MRNGEPIHVCGGRWMHRDDDCRCPCFFCRLYSGACNVIPPEDVSEVHQYDGQVAQNLGEEANPDG